MRIRILLFVLCGILSVKGSPVEIADQISVSKSDEALDSLESDEDSSSADESFEATNEVRTHGLQPAAQPSVVVEAITVIHAAPTNNDVSRKLGPVELSLRNVITASAVATEEIYLQMTSMNAETAHMINSKSEILTTAAMNELFQPLSKVESEIKKNGDCAKRYETTLNLIFKDIDTNLKLCTRNLTSIEERYKNNNLGTLHSLSIAGEDMYHLQESCELAQNFVAGTFCIVNNLAEMNERVVSDANVIRQNTLLAVEEMQTTITATELCQQAFMDNINEKLDNLSQEIEEKCVKRKLKSA